MNTYQVELTLEQLEALDTSKFTPEQLEKLDILKKTLKQQAIEKQAKRNIYYKNKKKKKKVSDHSRWINRQKAKAGRPH